MKRHHAIVFGLLIALSGCPATTEPDLNTNELWTSPQDESFVIYYRSALSVIADTIEVGKIQYRLDRARESFTELDSIVPLRGWVLGDLLLTVDDSLVGRFDPVTMRFSYGPIDSVLAAYPPDSSERRGGSSAPYFRLFYPRVYNIPVLAETFSAIPGVVIAGKNGIGVIPENCLTDVYLEIESSQYVFTFTRSGMLCSINQEWIVQVSDQAVNLLSMRSW